MTAEPKGTAPLPPRWFIRLAWAAHRAIYSITGGRRGLKRPTDDQWGMMRVRTVGRTGAEVPSWSLGELAVDIAGQSFPLHDAVAIAGRPPFAGWGVGGFLSPQHLTRRRGSYSP